MTLTGIIHHYLPAAAVIPVLSVVKMTKLVNLKKIIIKPNRNVFANVYVSSD